jgi:hypothetical protein
MTTAREEAGKLLAAYDKATADFTTAARVNEEDGWSSDMLDAHCDIRDARNELADPELMRALLAEADAMSAVVAAAQPIMERVAELPFTEEYIGTETPNVRVFIGRWVIKAAGDWLAAVQANARDGGEG